MRSCHTKRVVRAGFAASALIFIATPTPASAQVTLADLAVGKRVVLRIPTAALLRMDDNNWTLAGTAEIAVVGQRVTVNGSPDWRTAGLNLGRTAEITQVINDPARGSVEVRFSHWDGPEGVRFARRDARLVLAEGFAQPRDSERVRADNRSALREKIFAGPMATIAAAGQDSILDRLRYMIWRTPLRIDDFQGGRYLLMRATESQYSCAGGNPQDVDRQDAALREVGAPIIFNFGRADTTMSGSFGFAVEVAMKERGSCASANAPSDRLTMYVPARVAADYGRGAITDSAVVHGSIIVFRGKVRERM